MKGAVLYKKGGLKVEEVEKKSPGSREVTIKVEYCGVCGTDRHIFAGAEGVGYTPPGTVLGHEFRALLPKQAKK